MKKSAKHRGFFGTRLITSLLVVAFAASCIFAEATSGDIVVAFPGTPIADPALLLYSGKEGNSCVEYEGAIADPTVTLHNVSIDAGCEVEFDAFAPARGAYAVGVDFSNPASDDFLEAAMVAGSMDIALPSLTSLPLQIWLVGLTSQVTAMEEVRDRMLNKAFPVLSVLGTGFTLDTASAVLNPSLLTPHCNSADVISMNPAIYDASKLNVYFVAHYGNIQGLTPANNCWMKAHPEILFLSWQNANLTDPTLAHELGHALGLIHPKSLGGHTYAISGFDAYNLMATNTDVTSATVGQLYAMNFSSDSWINRSGSPLAKPVVRTCQDTWGAGECPALTLVQLGWPP